MSAFDSGKVSLLFQPDSQPFGEVSARRHDIIENRAVTDLARAFQCKVTGAKTAERNAAVQAVTIIDATWNRSGEAVGFDLWSTDSWAASALNGKTDMFDSPLLKRMPAFLPHPPAPSPKHQGRGANFCGFR